MASLYNKHTPPCRLPTYKYNCVFLILPALYLLTSSFTNWYIHILTYLNTSYSLLLPLDFVLCIFFILRMPLLTVIIVKFSALLKYLVCNMKISMWWFIVSFLEIMFIIEPNILLRWQFLFYRSSVQPLWQSAYLDAFSLHWLLSIWHSLACFSWATSSLCLS